MAHRAGAWVCGALLLAAGGCDAGLAPDGPRLQLTVDIEFGAPAPAVDVASIDRGIRITGRLVLPDLCYSVSDTLFTADPGAIRLELHVTGTGGACFDTFANMNFEALITGLTPGMYDVEFEAYRSGRIQVRYAQPLSVGGT